jgi:hypothetical protein
MGSDYIAPARMPFELRRAGFRVALLAPRDALASHTAFLDRVGYFPEDVRLFEWVCIVAGAIRATDPALVLPGDDITLRTLMQLVLDPPTGLDAETLDELGVVIRRSLGDPSGWLDSIDKSRLFELARRHGIAVADGAIATSEERAVAIAGELGCPVIVRSAFGTAGSGAARCESAGAIRAAMRGFATPDTWVPQGEPRFVVQRWIAGAVVTRASVAWNGRELCGVTRGRLETYPSPLGSASVVEFAGIPAVTGATDTLFSQVGMHGLVGTQFIIDAKTRIPHLIEVNRRMLPATHAGTLVGIDLAAALFAAVGGQEWAGPKDLPAGPGKRLALFPQEWYRDEGSSWLRTLPSDAPWHDPKLFAAMLRLPFETDKL